MSRIGKKPVRIPEGVAVEISGQTVRVRGPKGELSEVFRQEVAVRVADGDIYIERVSQTPKAKSLHGLYRTIVANMVAGVTAGWNKGLELVGVGYRASLSGTTLVLNVGFSHAVEFAATPGINFEVQGNTRINVSGADKQLVGETAAQIRRVRPPEPYKGKGIRYVGEVVARKPGKTAKAAAGALPGGGEARVK